MFPVNLVLLGASAVAVVAIIVSGRFLIATAHEMGNPDLDHEARSFIGYWALAVTVAILSVGTAVTIIAHAKNSSASSERIAQENKGDEVTPRDKPTMTALNEHGPKSALSQKPPLTGGE